MDWHYRYTLTVLCTLAFFVTMSARLVISPVVPLIMDEFTITNTQIGIALTGLWLTYGLAQFPSGIFAERYGEKPIILTAVGGTAIFSIFLAISPYYLIFVLSTLLLGSVAGLHYSVATTLLSRIYDNSGVAVGLHSIGAPAAGLIAPVAATWVGNRYGWRPAVALVVLVAFPTFVMIYSKVRPIRAQRPNQRMRSRLKLSDIVGFIIRPSIAFTMVITIIATSILQGTISFLPTFLINQHHYSATIAGILFGIFFIVMGIGQIGVGSISDTYGRDVSISGCMILGSIGFGVLVYGNQFLVVGGGIILVGIGLSFNAALHPRFLDVMSNSEQTRGFGLVRTVSGVIASMGSVATGLFADLFGWTSSFLILAQLLLLVFLILLINSLSFKY